MKKTIVLTAMTLLTNILLADIREHNIGLQLGFNEHICRLNSPSDYASDKTKLGSLNMDGIKLGLVYDGTMIKGFGYTLGISYAYTHHKTDWGDYPYTEQGRPIADGIVKPIQVRTLYNHHIGELFVDWQYKFEIASETYLMLYTGPAIEVSLSTTAQDTYKYRANDIELTITSPHYSIGKSEVDNLRRMNVTWGVGAGVQYKQIFLRGGYDFGLINPYKATSFGDMGFTYNGDADGRLTRGRIDHWQIKVGYYIWQSDHR